MYLKIAFQGRKGLFGAAGPSTRFLPSSYMSKGAELKYFTAVLIGRYQALSSLKKQPKS